MAGPIVDPPPVVDPAPSGDRPERRPRWHRRPANPGAVHVANLLGLGAGLFFVIGGYHEWAVVQPIAGGATTTGVVVAVTDGQSCGRYSCSPNWTPTISFTVPRGTYEFVGPTSSSEVSVGDSVKVSYLPSNPAVAHDVSSSGAGGVLKLGLGTLIGVFSLGSFLLGLGWVHRKTGLTPARPGNGWVGHKVLHSNNGLLWAIAGSAAIAVVAYFVI